MYFGGRRYAKDMTTGRPPSWSPELKALLPSLSLECTVAPHFNSGSYLKTTALRWLSLEGVRCCWNPLNPVCNWTPLRPLCQLVGFLAVSVAIYVCLASPERSLVCECLLVKAVTYQVKLSPTKEASGLPLSSVYPCPMRERLMCRPVHVLISKF